ncbi:MAG: DUF3035 domain-containing protein [Pseudomonadota bacterium]
MRLATPSCPGERTRRRCLAAALVVALGFGLSGCGDARKALGWDKATPDEFRIVSRAPLSLPPDYALRPPQPGAPRPQEATAPESARQSILGAGRARSPVPAATRVADSPGLAAILTRAGAGRADPGIRQIVDREATALAEAERTFLDQLIFWREADEPGEVVDAAREAQRLRENTALGRSLGEGNTPSIRRRRKGPLEGIF